MTYKAGPGTQKLVAKSKHLGRRTGYSSHDKAASVKAKSDARKRSSSKTGVKNVSKNVVVIHDLAPPSQQTVVLTATKTPTAQNNAQQIAHTLHPATVLTANVVQANATHKSDNSDYTAQEKRLISAIEAQRAREEQGNKRVQTAYDTVLTAQPIREVEKNDWAVTRFSKQAGRRAIASVATAPIALANAGVSAVDKAQVTGRALVVHPTLVGKEYRRAGKEAVTETVHIATARDPTSSKVTVESITDAALIYGGAGLSAKATVKARAPTKHDVIIKKTQPTLIESQGIRQINYNKFETGQAALEAKNVPHLKPETTYKDLKPTRQFNLQTQLKNKPVNVAVIEVDKAVVPAHKQPYVWDTAGRSPLQTKLTSKDVQGKWSGADPAVTIRRTTESGVIVNEIPSSRQYRDASNLKRERGSYQRSLIEYQTPHANDVIAATKRRQFSMNKKGQWGGRSEYLIEQESPFGKFDRGKSGWDDTKERYGRTPYDRPRIPTAKTIPKIRVPLFAPQQQQPELVSIPQKEQLIIAKPRVVEDPAPKQQQEFELLQEPVQEYYYFPPERPQTKPKKPSEPVPQHLVHPPTSEQKRGTAWAPWLKGLTDGQLSNPYERRKAWIQWAVRKQDPWKRITGKAAYSTDMNKRLREMYGGLYN